MIKCSIVGLRAWNQDIFLTNSRLSRRQLQWQFDLGMPIYAL